MELLGGQEVYLERVYVLFLSLNESACKFGHTKGSDVIRRTSGGTFSKIAKANHQRNECRELLQIYQPGWCTLASVLFLTARIASKKPPPGGHNVFKDKDSGDAS